MGEDAMRDLLVGKFILSEIYLEIYQQSHQLFCFSYYRVNVSIRQEFPHFSLLSSQNNSINSISNLYIITVLSDGVLVGRSSVRYCWILCAFGASVIIDSSFETFVPTDTRLPKWQIFKEKMDHWKTLGY